MNISWHQLLLRAVNCTSDEEAECILGKIEELIAEDRKRIASLEIDNDARSHVGLSPDFGEAV